MEEIIQSSVLFFPKVVELLSKLPKDIIDLCDEGQAIIAGGAFRSIFSNENPNDVDIFIEDKNIFLDIVRKFDAKLDEESSGAQIRINDLLLDIQWTLGYPLMEVVLLSDITIAQIGYTKKFLFYNENFFSHIDTKTFLLTGISLDPEKTEARGKKYEGYGFRPLKK